jgi:ParB-like chromosome segregation protein Spo0J
VRLYADGIQRGGAFPPIAVIYRPDNPDKVYGPWLVDDGMHRISALKLLGHQSIAAFVASDSLETLQEALLVAQSLNPASIELG